MKFLGEQNYLDYYAQYLLMCCSNSNFYYIQKPTADDGGDYKCVVKNDLGQLQAKLNLNIEAEPATPTPAASVVGAPTFTEKPKIETLEGGKRVQMIVRYKAEAQCQCQWFFKESKVVESTTTKVIHEKRESYYECRLEMTVNI